MYPKLNDKEWLEKMSAEFTDRIIAKYLGCTGTAVYKARKRHGVKAKRYERLGMKMSELHDKKWLVEHADVPAEEIAETLGCAKSTVCTAYRKAGVKRPRKQKELVVDDGGHMIGSPEAVEHFRQKEKCFVHLANKMIDGTWNGEWCEDLKRDRIKRDLERMGFGTR